MVIQGHPCNVIDLGANRKRMAYIMQLSISQEQ